ncbi:hypothetical protein TVAG_476300 [Trichomonas vaginalis G3]|uniref:Uncharacterized protein n=1 Tax=Trichomonas vaginalis (strain ATCC PRA-98 / G3) TaxID=412133 RepID=A2DA53_TRIV3|nr:hypothetical protein TVAGG3_0266310 [Trichomonas vaginalis G3]EAY22701.1 hypothetical protein TVAG_476300 [Trichomonas vaginalis G3]KAI5525514.1 hypothetical protein TVAGG3_0266310 [Trichomonas vaginalis G3]|eukprot:XP_001583687.1 hypothetical protein [Trichomonas vaginalis G3]
MSSFGPFSTEAHRLEQDNLQMRREIDELRSELNRKTKKLERVIEELRITKDQMSRSQLSKHDIHEETYPRKYSRRDDRNYNQCCCCKCCCHCDPMNDLSRTEESLQRLVSKYDSLKEDYKDLERENARWSEFCYFLYGIASTNLQYFPEYPENHPDTQRKVVMSLIRKICKVGGKEISEHAEFESLKNKYSKVTKGISTVHHECDNLDAILHDYPSYYNRRTGEITRIENDVFDEDASSARKRKYSNNEHKEKISTKTKEVSPASISRSIKKVQEKIENVSNQANTKPTSLKSDIQKLHEVTKQIKEDYKSMSFNEKDIHSD